MADRKISQLIAAIAEDVSDDDQFVFADISAGAGDMGNQSLTRLQLKRTLTLGAQPLASDADIGALQAQIDANATIIASQQDQIDALTSGARIVGEWDAGSGAFPTTRPDGSAIQPGDAWIVSGDGTVDGIAFSEADRLVALVAGGGATYADNWVRAGYADLLQDLIDGSQPYASKAAFIAATIPSLVTTVRVLGGPGLLTYVRDATGHTVHSDSSIWRLVYGTSFATVADLTSSTYAFDEDDDVIAGGFRYIVAGATETDHHVQTAGGVKLWVQPIFNGRYHVDAFGAPTDAGTDATAYFNKAIAAGPATAAPRTYTVNGIVLTSGLNFVGSGSRTGAMTRLTCSTLNGTIFNKSDGGAVHNIRLEDFAADASVKGVVFFNSTATNAYTGTVRMRNVNTTNNFRLVFRAIPIYWRVRDCVFGADGHRFSGQQAFQILYAWVSGGAAIANYNLFHGCTFYHCKNGTDAGQTIEAAFHMRIGILFTFSNCSAEQGDVPVIRAQNFGLIEFKDGWIEQNTATYMFNIDFDAGAPVSINSGLFLLENVQFQGMAGTTHLVRNPNTYVSVRNVYGTGALSGIAIATAPTLIYDARGIRGSGWETVLAGVSINRNSVTERGLNHVSGQVPPHVGGAKVSYWAKKVAAGWTLSSTGSAPTVDNYTSKLTGDGIARYIVGNNLQAAFFQVPADQLDPIKGRTVTMAITCYGISGLTAGGNPLTPRAWFSVTPTHSNYTAGTDRKLMAPNSTVAQVVTATFAIPSDATSMHVGFTSPAAFNGGQIAIETVHLFDGDLLIEVPIYQ